MAAELLDSLTSAQRDAVQYVDGPLLILAGPGSGKTRVITHRVAYLIDQGVHPGAILALTFTNKAANEMKERVQRLSPDAHSWIGTFHGFCSRLLRRYAGHVGLESNFTIYDTSDSRQALKRAMTSLDLPLKMRVPDRVAHQISWLKNHLILPEDYAPSDGNELGAIITKVYPAYQHELLAANAVDFDDLLLHIVAILQGSNELRASLDEAFRYVMVDEYQDTNMAQYAIVRALSNDYPNLAVTGDPDQSIYGWRGANLNNILDFETDYPNVRVVRLEQNYRSTPNILSAAQALISNNRRRKEKALFTENKEGSRVRLVKYQSHIDEANEIVARIAAQISDGRQPRDFAVFYRINALSRVVEHALREHGIPYQIVHGVEFYQRKEIKDALAYLQLIYNPRDNNALTRIINVPPRLLGKTTVNRLAEYARAQGISMLEAVRQNGSIESLPKAARPRLSVFGKMIDSLAVRAGESVEELLGLVMMETGYLPALRESEMDEDADRAANVEELLAAAREFDRQNAEPDALGAFLEQASLVNDIDDWDEQTNRVTLMTLHAAKGLEFDSVFIIGVEQGLLPHERSLRDPVQEEEERRLLFVGITRARHELQLSRATIRAHRGGLTNTIPSPFLVELPRGEMEVIDGSVSNVRLHRETIYTSDELIDGPTSDFDSSPSPTDPIAKVRMASQMIPSSEDTASDDEDAPVNPDLFQIGMTVLHPKYGPGKVAALSGVGKNRTGTINFATAGPKRIVLAMSKLRPAK